MLFTIEIIQISNCAFQFLYFILKAVYLLFYGLEWLKERSIVKIELEYQPKNIERATIEARPNWIHVSFFL